jgi:hypothetical protein
MLQGVQKDYALVASTVYASCKQNLKQLKSVTVSKVYASK